MFIGNRQFIYGRLSSRLRIFIFCTACFILILGGCSEKISEKQIYTEVDLGEKLFFERLLSRDSTISCASCHKPEFAFADNVPTSKGVANRVGIRNSPSVMNLVDRNFYFWDGRAESIEEQVFGPIQDHLEMDLPLSLAIRRLKKREFYKKAFLDVYGKEPSRDLLAKAIASFENTLETSNTAFDDYVSGNDTTVLSESAKRGLFIFNNKGKCFDCHFGSDFTGNDQFKNIGLYNSKDLNDVGRFKITGKEKDLGTFKTPGLRNIAKTAPYMHNGMFKTLKEVINYYNEPDKIIGNSINRDTLLRKPLGLSDIEKNDLENFLLSLTDRRFLQK